MRFATQIMQPTGSEMVRREADTGGGGSAIPTMSAWTATVFSLWAVYWAALFAQLAHLRMLDDGVGALAFGWVSGALLTAGLGCFVTTIGT